MRVWAEAEWAVVRRRSERISKTVVRMGALYPSWLRLLTVCLCQEILGGFGGNGEVVNPTVAASGRGEILLSCSDDGFADAPIEFISVTKREP